MKSIFILLKGENGKAHQLIHDELAIDDKELDRLESDFNQYLSEVVQEYGGSVVKGGVYECSIDEKTSKLFLRFDDVLAIY